MLIFLRNILNFSAFRYDGISDLFKYIRIIIGFIGNRIYLVYILGIFAALCESLGVTILMPYLMMALSKEQGIIFPIGIEQFNGTLHFFFQDFLPSTIVIMFVMIFFAKSGLVFLAQFIGAQFRGLLLKRIKLILFDNLVKVNYQYYRTLDSGNLANLVNEQASKSIIAYNALITWYSCVSSLYLP